MEATTRGFMQPNIVPLNVICFYNKKKLMLETLTTYLNDSGFLSPAHSRHRR